MDCAPCYHRNLLLDKMLSKLPQHLECYHLLYLHDMALIKRHGQLIPRCSHAIAYIFCRIFENTRHMMHKKMRMSHAMTITSCHLHTQFSPSTNHNTITTFSCRSHQQLPVRFPEIIGVNGRQTVMAHFLIRGITVTHHDLQIQQ